MTGRTRLPGGEPRKASQRNKRNVASSGAAKLTPIWRASMPVLWKGRAGIFRREVGDGEHAEGGDRGTRLSGADCGLTLIAGEYAGTQVHSRPEGYLSARVRPER